MNGNFGPQHGLILRLPKSEKKVRASASDRAGTLKNIARNVELDIAAAAHLIFHNDAPQIALRALRFELVTALSRDTGMSPNEVVLQLLSASPGANLDSRYAELADLFGTEELG